MNIWLILEIEKTNDKNAIKRAYASKLKNTNPESNQDAFKVLREAYERAIEYANGESVSEQLDASCSAPESHEKSTTPHDSGYSSEEPEKIVDLVLRILETDENEAGDFIKNISKDERFDNIEFSDRFQRNLAINLLAHTPRHNIFVLICMDQFGWVERLKQGISDVLFRIAIINLRNNLDHLYFMNNMRYVSQLSTEADLVSHNIKLEDARAAKILLGAVNIFKFYMISFFKPKESAAIVKLVKKIKHDYPDTLGLSLSYPSLVWWWMYDLGVTKKLIEFLGVIALIIIVTFGYYWNDINPRVSNQLEENEKSKTHDDVASEKISLKSYENAITFESPSKLNYSDLNVRAAMVLSGEDSLDPKEIIKEIKLKARDLPQILTAEVELLNVKIKGKIILYSYKFLNKKITDFDFKFIWNFNNELCHDFNARTMLDAGYTYSFHYKDKGNNEAELVRVSKDDC